MPAGRPYGPNDPSLMSSLETAVRRGTPTGAGRAAPGTGAGKLACSPSSPSSPDCHHERIGLIGLVVARGPGWRPAQRRCCAGRQPADGRPGLVRHHPAPGQSWLRERLGADQERQAADHLVHHAHGLRRAGPTVVRAGLTRRRPDRRQRRARGRLLGGGGSRCRRALGTRTWSLCAVHKNQLSRTRADSYLDTPGWPRPAHRAGDNGRPRHRQGHRAVNEHDSAYRVDGVADRFQFGSGERAGRPRGPSGLRPVPSRSLTARTRSWATSMTSRVSLAWPVAFLALTASPSMTMQ